MKNKDLSEVLAVVGVIVFLLILGAIADAGTPKCIKDGCNNEKADGSEYCYLHKPVKSTGSYGGSSSYKSSSSTGKSTYSGPTSTTEVKNQTDSYKSTTSTKKNSTTSINFRKQL